MEKQLKKYESASKSAVSSTSTSSYHKILSEMYKAPGICPVTGCESFLSASYALSHMLYFHTTNDTVPQVVKTVHSEDSLVLDINIEKMETHKTEMLGILLYSGKRNAPKPAECGDCLPNADLLNIHEKFAFDLPIIVFGVNTFLEVLSEEPNAKDMTEKIILVWLVSPYKCPNIICTLSMHDKLIADSTSSAVEVSKLGQKIETLQKILIKNLGGFYLSKHEIEMYRHGDGLHKLHIRIEEI